MNSFQKNEQLDVRYTHYWTVHSIFATQGVLDPQILEWFVGFCEGDGSFICSKRKSTGKYEFCVEFTQKDKNVLHYIQHTFGFGNIYPTKANNWVLKIRKKEHLLHCLVLCAGNMRLKTRTRRFAAWALLFFRQYEQQMKKQLETRSNKKKRKKPSSQDLWFQALHHSLRSRAVLKSRLGLDLGTAWLSGFTEADGCFVSEFRLSSSYSLGYQCMIRVRFRQNAANEEFRQLQTFVGGYLRHEGESWELVASAEPVITQLVHYFTRYPMRGRKRIAQERWKRAYRIRAQKRPLPSFESLEYFRFVRLFTSINACQ